MKRKILLLSLLIFTTVFLFGQSKLTPKQISKRNYQEVIGYRNLIDTIIPDKYAMYPNGVNGINSHIVKHITYPKDARNRGVQGQVILEFVVNKNGTIGDIQVVQSIDSKLDAEAIRVLKKLDIWVPGYKNGKPIVVRYRCPFTFIIT